MWRWIKNIYGINDEGRGTNLEINLLIQMRNSTKIIESSYEGKGADSRDTKSVGRRSWGI